MLETVSKASGRLLIAFMATGIRWHNGLLQDEESAVDHRRLYGWFSL